MEAEDDLSISGVQGRRKATKSWQHLEKRLGEMVVEVETGLNG